MANDFRIGIIGGGIAGSSLAYFARESFGTGTDIVVFEKTPEIGGRIQDVSVNRRTYEMGGKLVHTRNQHLSSFVDELGLETRDIAEVSEQRLGIWDGESFVFKTADRDWMTLLKLLGRYRLSVRTAQSNVSDMIRKIDQIYEPPRSRTGFATPKELLESLDLDELIDRSGYDYFETRGISDRFVREFMNGTARSIYAQDASMHALACLIVLAAVEQAGATFAIKGGNVQLCQGLLDAAAADVRTDTPVRTITRRNGQKTRSTYTLETANGETTNDAFDAICIATPLELGDIELDEIDVPPGARSRDYLEVQVSLVVGQLDPRYFDEWNTSDVPGFVVTESGVNDPFLFLLKRDETSDGGAAIYQLWNRQQVSKERLSEVFESISEIRQITWEAFPRLVPGETMPPFRLCSGCYYVNAMESIVSTMETEVIGSRNVANLLADDFTDAVPSN